jgi:RNase adaptor protein for sRNA GlmZ degradation
MGRDMNEFKTGIIKENDSGLSQLIRLKIHFKAYYLLHSNRSRKSRIRTLEYLQQFLYITYIPLHPELQLREDIPRNMNQAPETQRMHIKVLSFGYKHGLPLEADLLLDVRFIPNPYYIPELKNLDGKDARVRQFVTKWPETLEFFEKYLSVLEYLIPLYEKEGRPLLTLAFGCTGGRHRSVVIAEEIFARLSARGQETALTHRDVELV